MKRHEKIKAVPERLRSMKKRIKQSLALVGMLVMSLSLSGCEKLVETDVSAETRSQTSYNGTQNATDTTNKSEFHYITDWSIDEVVQNIEMNGKVYSMPFTVGDLGEKYSLEANDQTPGGYFLNYCGDEDYALIDVYNDDADIKKCRIRSITVNDDVDFKIDNLSFGVKKEKILEKYGEPSLATNEVVWTYVFEGETEDQNSVLLFTFNKKGKLDGISIGYNKYKEKTEKAESIGKDSYGSPAYPLPDDWTFEKIINLIEIDGVPLSLSSDAEDFNNINKKIKAEWDKNFIYYYDVYYEDDIILTAEKKHEKTIDYINVRYVGDDQEIIDAITFAGYSLREVNEIYDYMDKNFIASQSGGVGKRYSFIDGNSVLEIGFVGDYYENPTALSIIIRVSEVEE